jgi:glucuronyl/N-acetylglucosaminyl transferase EXT2
MFRGMNFKKRLVYLLVIILILALLVLFLWSENERDSPSLEPDTKVDSQTIASNIPLPLLSIESCRMHTNDCFNIYRCGYNDGGRISVYVYPFTNYFDDEGLQISPSFSKEFYHLVKAIEESTYYTSHIDKACIIVPPLDLLNQMRVDNRHAGQILSSLPRYMSLS